MAEFQVIDPESSLYRKSFEKHVPTESAPAKAMAVLAKHCSCPEDFSQETVCVDLIAGQIDKQQYMLDSYH